MSITINRKLLLIVRDARFVRVETRREGRETEKESGGRERGWKRELELSVAERENVKERQREENTENRIQAQAGYEIGENENRRDENKSVSGSNARQK